MFVASFKTTRELNVVLGLLLLTFLVLGIGDIAASSGLTKAGGYLGLLTAAGAAYLAMAELTNATFGRERLSDPPAELRGISKTPSGDLDLRVSGVADGLARD